ncbi:MAG: transglycosylase domain-containing protein [Bacteroidota bacterium]|nr:transglycosylase domain-containing protein [Bacteroidota bacterium]
MQEAKGSFLKKTTRRITRYYRRHGLFKTLMALVGLVFLSASAGVVCFVLLVWSGFFAPIPSGEQLKEIHHPIASEVYSVDSVLLGRYYLQDRTPVDSADIPKTLKQALVATEDIRFYEHNGVDIKSLFRVLVKTLLLQKESSGGGSTITQQLAKNLYPRRRYAMLSLPINKVREMIIASRLEDIYSKNEILVLYLNTIPFADNTYGVKTAADRFFSTAVRDLTIDQSAMLVGMLKATHNYNPRLFPERAIERRNLVISQMEKYHFISVDEEKILQQKPLGLEYNNVGDSNGIAAYFRAYIKNELLDWCQENRRDDGNAYNLYTDGLKIYTTIDSRLQRYAEAAMEKQMKGLQEKFAKQLNKKKLDNAAMKRLRRLPQYVALKETGMSETEILKALKKPVKTKIYTWDGIRQVNMSIYDSVKHHMQFLQAGVLAMEPGTGEIRAWVGGIDHRFFQYDHVRPGTKRQVGSTLKPILYTAALEKGIGPCTYISAGKTEYTNLDDWTPENTDQETYDRKYSMEGGLSGSVNTVSVKLLEKTGIDDAIDIARKMGITSDLPAVPSLALGTPSISMMEMVGAYGTLANGGVYTSPRYILAIADRHGNILEKIKAEDDEPVRAVSKESAQMMVHMLKSVVSEGTGSSLRTRFGIHNDVAGKTGTTQLNVDGWFMAMTPHLVIGSWVGADDPTLHFRSTSLGQGAATALPITAYFLEKVNHDKTLREISQARFSPLSAELLEELDCKTYKSDLNIFQRIFKKKKKTKVKKFRGVKD